MAHKVEYIHAKTRTIEEELTGLLSRMARPLPAVQLAADAPAAARAAMLFASCAVEQANVELDQLCETLRPALTALAAEPLQQVEQTLSWFERVRLRTNSPEGEVTLWSPRDALLREAGAWGNPQLEAFLRERQLLTKLAAKAAEICSTRISPASTPAARARLLKKIDIYEKARVRLLEKVNKPPARAPSPPKPPSPPTPVTPPVSPPPGAEEKGLALFFAKKTPSHLFPASESSFPPTRGPWNVLGCFPSSAAAPTPQFLAFLDALPLRPFPTREAALPDTPTKSARPPKQPLSSLEQFFAKKRVNGSVSREELLEQYRGLPAPALPAPAPSRYKYLRYEEGSAPREWKGLWARPAGPIRGSQPLLEAPELINYELGSVEEMQLLDADSCSKISEESESLPSAELSGFLVPDEPETSATNRPAKLEQAELCPLLIEDAELLHQYKAVCLAEGGLPLRLVKAERPKKALVSDEVLRDASLHLLGLSSRREGLCVLEGRHPGLGKRLLTQLLPHTRRVLLLQPELCAAEGIDPLALLRQNFGPGAQQVAVAREAGWAAALYRLLQGCDTNIVVREERCFAPLLAAFPSLSRQIVEKKAREAARPGLALDPEHLSRLGLGDEQLRAALLAKPSP